MSDERDSAVLKLMGQVLQQADFTSHKSFFDYVKDELKTCFSHHKELFWLLGLNIATHNNKLSKKNLGFFLNLTAQYCKLQIKSDVATELLVFLYNVSMTYFDVMKEELNQII